MKIDCQSQLSRRNTATESIHWRHSRLVRQMGWQVPVASIRSKSLLACREIALSRISVIDCEGRLCAGTN